jgi:hypothetical protein
MGVGDFMAASDFNALIGVVVGGLIGYGGQLLQHSLQQRSARASARAIALAYVDGVLQMEGRRQHGVRSKLALDGLKKGTSMTLPKIFGADTYPNPNEIQKVVIGQLSLLKPDDARDMVQFLNLGDGLDADDVAMSTGKMDNLLPQQKIDILEGDIRIRDEMVEVGRRLVRRLKD